ncbi:hypothetical protein XENORESO_015640 [Xenotaenia resolanae]|uniref:Uncharacterized protein n=1 Tax=Xenotaenia resolanae TaxID=208358 RepID=A0ABV0VMB4_9TELE
MLQIEISHYCPAPVSAHPSFCHLSGMHPVRGAVASPLKPDSEAVGASDLHHASGARRTVFAGLVRPIQDNDRLQKKRAVKGGTFKPPVVEGTGRECSSVPTRSIIRSYNQRNHLPNIPLCSFNRLTRFKISKNQTAVFPHSPCLPLPCTLLPCPPYSCATRLCVPHRRSDNQRILPRMPKFVKTCKTIFRPLEQETGSRKSMLPVPIFCLKVRLKVRGHKWLLVSSHQELCAGDIPQIRVIGFLIQLETFFCP